MPPLSSAPHLQRPAPKPVPAPDPSDWVTESVLACATPDALRKLLGRSGPSHGTSDERRFLMAATHGCVFDDALLRRLFAFRALRAPLALNPHLSDAQRTLVLELLLTVARYGNHTVGTELTDAMVVPGYHAPRTLVVQLLECALQPYPGALGAAAAVAALQSPMVTHEELVLLWEEWLEHPAVEAAVLRHPHCPHALVASMLEGLTEWLEDHPLPDALKRGQGILAGAADRPDLLRVPAFRDALTPFAEAEATLAARFHETASSETERWRWFEAWAGLDPAAAMDAVVQARYRGAPLPPREALTPIFQSSDAQLRVRASIFLTPLLEGAPASIADAVAAADAARPSAGSGRGRR